MTRPDQSEPGPRDRLPEVFVLSRPHGTVRARGVRRVFTDVTAAATALRDREIDALTGAIPFDVADPAALVAPLELDRSDAPLVGRAPRRRVVLEQTAHPDAAEHRDRVGRAVKRIADGELAKVVLARRVDLTVDPPVEPDELLAALAAGNTAGNAFGVDLDPATGAGSWLLGASPEVLLRKQGRVVTCHPYAGSAARCTDPAADRAAAEALAASAKDRTEHAFVVDFLRDRLAELSDDVEAPDEPQVHATGEVWHLATPIRATLRDPAITAFDLALLLGPTPAVGGTPSDAAAQLIREFEGDRGLYAGAVGWCDGAGDGEWMVTIRCVELGADRRHLRTWAGGGIVIDSDPAAELAETDVKLRTVRNALGLD